MGTWQGLVEVNRGRLTEEIYERISNNHLMFSGMVVEELRGSFRVQFMHVVEDQEFKTVKKVARQWDMKRVVAHIVSRIVIENKIFKIFLAFYLVYLCL